MRSFTGRIESTNYLVFDGDCGICTRSAEICGRIDKNRQFAIVPFQDIPEAELRRFDLDYQKCSGEVQVINSTGRVYGGTFAVNYFLFQQRPWKAPILFIYLIPLLLLFEIIGYKIVARNRTRISQWLGLAACRVKHT